MEITRHTEPDCPECETPVRFELSDGEVFAEYDE